MGYVLEVNGLTKIYPSFELKPVNFHVEAGEVMGFIGRNGAGKTTTLKAILNLVHPHAGSVRIEFLRLVRTPFAGIVGKCNRQ